MKVIVTLPPYADFHQRVVEHPLVCGARVNTVMPYRVSPRELLQRFGGLSKPLWVDLKGRQLRVVGGAVPPFTTVELSHRVQVPTPCLAAFGSGRELVKVLAVDGNRLFLEDGPRRYIGPGESVNLLHPQLRIEGYLTAQDVEYLHAMRELGLHRVMLSFFEEPSDLAQVRELLPDAEVVAKLESAHGLDRVPFLLKERVQPMVARGDLLVELGCPVATLEASQRVIEQAPGAWIASRFLASLSRSLVAHLADVMDVAACRRLGYSTLMLGDEVCQREDTLLNALDTLLRIQTSDKFQRDILVTTNRCSPAAAPLY